MGYWNATAKGDSLVLKDTGIVWGDSPADVMDGALKVIFRIFMVDVGRPPTLKELKGGLLFSAPLFLEEKEAWEDKRTCKPDPTKFHYPCNECGTCGCNHTKRGCPPDLKS